MPAPAAAITVRALTADDLSAVVAIDAELEGRSRRVYFQRRLESALHAPALHVQWAAVDAQGLAGYVLARVMRGEFGHQRASLRLEAVGVRPALRQHGVGRQLLQALNSYAKRHDIQEIRTAAAWNNHAMLAWFDKMGFHLAGGLVLECSLDDARARTARDSVPTGSDAAPEQREIDYGSRAGNDFEQLARDLADVRAMAPSDLHEIVRVDRSITGRDRSAYISAQLDEAMDDSAIRVSLCARCDGAVVGYLMARADLGDFGRTEPVAVIDTLGVDREYAGRGVGRALLSQLFANLEALRVERVETAISPTDARLLAFLARNGFTPAQRLAFVRDVA
ncbi:MAG: GNAT family N-acetyltransferase [Aquabacterium sp.]|nr:GNAT family N-acetyltransferase [Aquabacterium sp.]